MMNSTIRSIPFLCAALVASVAAQDNAPESRPADSGDRHSIPTAVASFGAAVCDGHLYVQGGHIGRAHAHSKDNVVAEFWRLPLTELRGEESIEASAWERLPDGATVQGTALVANDGLLYRVGGLSAHNEPGAEEDLRSLASVSVYDPAKGEWRDTTPLPEPRSSHDATVIDGKLYVVGGWTMRGKGEESRWLDTVWVADLGAEPLEWRALPKPPFVRRALAVSRLGDRLAVIGGLDEEGEMTVDTFYFDLEEKKWHDGPMFPDHPFGVAAIGDEELLLVSGLDGALRGLSPAELAKGWNNEEGWKTLATLETPRFFHRLLRVDEHRFVALGGASKRGHLAEFEFLEIDRL